MYAPYKNDILKKWQNALRERGITDQSYLQLLTAQALQENGALSPDVVGDGGCSLGLPQRNFCSHAGIYASTAVKRWPEWKDIDFQIDWFADNMKRHLEEQGDIKWAVIAHNRPASARNRQVTVYWSDVNKRKSSIEWTQ
jgi:hypothetical protein